MTRAVHVHEHVNVNVHVNVDVNVDVVVNVIGFCWVFLARISKQGGAS